MTPVRFLLNLVAKNTSFRPEILVEVEHTRSSMYFNVISYQLDVLVF